MRQKRICPCSTDAALRDAHLAELLDFLVLSGREAVGYVQRGNDPLKVPESPPDTRGIQEVATTVQRALTCAFTSRSDKRWPTRRRVWAVQSEQFDVQSTSGSRMTSTRSTLLGYMRGIGGTRRPRNWLLRLSISLKRCFPSVLYLATFLIRLTPLYRGHDCERARHLLAAFFFEQSRRLDYEVTTLTRESSVEKLEHMVQEILVPLVSELHESAPCSLRKFLFNTSGVFVSCLSQERGTDRHRFSQTAR